MGSLLNFWVIFSDSEMSRNDKLRGIRSLGLKWNNYHKGSFCCHCFWELRCAAEMELGHQVSNFGWVRSGQCVRPVFDPVMNTNMYVYRGVVSTE